MLFTACLLSRYIPLPLNRVRLSLRLTASRPQKAKGSTRFPAEEASKRYSGLQKPPADQLFGISALSGGLLRNIRNRLFPASRRTANRPRQVSSPPATPSLISRFGKRMAGTPVQFMPLNRTRVGTRFHSQPQSGCCFGLWRSSSSLCFSALCPQGNIHVPRPFSGMSVRFRHEKASRFREAFLMSLGRCQYVVRSKTAFCCVNSSRPARPPSRPMPLCL